MRVYIICSMAGAVGIFAKEQCEVGSRTWRKARHEITLDVNAAIEALRRVGYQEILIKDIYGRGTNLQKRMLIPGVHYEPGIYLEPIPILGEMRSGTCAILIGFHARAATAGAFLAQTFSPDVTGVWVNGKPFGEAEIMGATLGEIGIEVNFLSGDAATVEQAKTSMPWLETLTVPKSGSTEAGALIRKRNELRALVQRSCERTKSKERIFKVSGPVEFEVRFGTRQEADERNSWGLRQSEESIFWESADYLSGYRQLIHLLYVPRAMRGLAPNLYRFVNWAYRIRDALV